MGLHDAVDRAPFTLAGLAPRRTDYSAIGVGLGGDEFQIFSPQQYCRIYDDPGC